MKTLLLLLLSLGLAALRPAATTTFTVQPAASRLTWTGYAEAGSWAPSGSLQLARGTFSYDGRHLKNGRFEFDMTTITHAEAQLQQHLRGADFFDVTQFPTAVFVLRDVVGGVARGQLTLKSITRPVQFPVTLTARPDGSLQLRGAARIDRTQFGVNYNSSSFFQNLGSYAIRNDFELRFDLLAIAAK